MIFVSFVSNLLRLQTIKDMQTSLRDGATVLQSFSDELKRGMNEEKEEIHALYTSLYDSIRKQYEGTMREIDG